MIEDRISVTIECEVIEDACAELVRIHFALRGRHGDAYRALDKRVGRVLHDPDGIVLPEPLPLPGGRMVFALPDDIAAILRDARALGI